MQNFGNPVLSSPSIDFRSVRDQRRASLFYYDLDLSTARSASALTALLLNVSGNVVYIDADPSGGNALIHFQDGNYDRGPVPVYASPGAIFNVPFTQLLIENTAQAGKKLRIVYGVDVDFQPGSVAQVAITGATTDDYIAKSAGGTNYSFAQGQVVGAGATGYFFIKNISNPRLYRINDVTVTSSYAGAAATLPVTQLWKVTAISTAPNSQSTNTKDSSKLSNSYFNIVGVTGTATDLIYAAAGNALSYSAVNRSPIYVNANDAFLVTCQNNTAGGGAFYVNINYDSI